MTTAHDPLCRSVTAIFETVEQCAWCDLIARVREDERGRILALSERVKESQYAAALRDAVAATRDQRSKFKARDWDDAIDAVVAAIEALGGER